ncbi:envelope stress response membrane protein PspB [Fodinicurvata sp. EGI_FJ10296]|uniref:envelope stress response membrane protein PspB n=1 Tax=Fodinicurvata sp. EGI_FJ10296 TaxID=3231908 RepID=UPI003455D885
MMDLLQPVLILFVVVVVPLWLLLHYATRWKASRTLSTEDEKMLVDLWQSASRMEDRINTLETILDQDAPGWRGRKE